jgi:hypothetical protein
MIRQIICAAALAALIPAASKAQTENAGPRVTPEAVLQTARQHIQRGEGCISRGDVDCARREFDSALDAVLESGIDLRANQTLLAGWREMIEVINRHETTPLVAGGGSFWRQQEYDGLPAKEEIVVRQAPMVAGTFQQRFTELQKRFREKYDRDITLTGADHAEHRRLYGPGSAYDIRVRDLTREQVKFIIATGNALDLRIKDFSTWESVAAHNARSIKLGRPSDTFATGIHLHIDRMALPQSKKLISTHAVKSGPRQEVNHNR